MTQSSKLSMQMSEAVRTKDWSFLESCFNEEVSSNLNKKDREILAELLLEHCVKVLSNAIEASSLHEALMLAQKCSKLDKHSIASLSLCAEASYKLAVLEEDSEQLNESLSFFLEADQLAKMQGSKLSANVFWFWALALHRSAKCSEEADDLKNALAKFQEANSLGLESAEFLLDYGTAMGEMGLLIGNPNILLESAAILEKSIFEKGDQLTAWLRLACTYKVLYFMTADLFYFEKADTSFVAAHRLIHEDPKSDSISGPRYELTVNWAQLLIYEGKMLHDEELLMLGIDKLKPIHFAVPEDPMVLTILGDSYTHFGVFKESFEHMKEGHQLLEKAHALFPNNIEIICHLAHCLANIGKYLSDPKYLNRAIDTFQKGVSRDKNNHQLWCGLAMANYVLGELTDNPALYEKSIRFCALVVKLGGESPAFWNDWGVVLMRLGEATNDSRYIAEAIEKFESAIQSYQKKSVGIADPDWFYNYGCALDWMGTYDPNPQYFERAILILTRLGEQYPELNHIRYNLGLALYHLGDTTGEVEILEEAVQQLQLYIQTEPEDDLAVSDLGLTFLTIATLLQENIRNERSIEAFSKAEYHLKQAISLGNTRANYYFGCLMTQVGQFEQALHFLNRSKQYDALPPKQVLLEDEWIEPLLEVPEFHAFLSSLA